MLAVEAISIRYGRVTVVRDLSLSINRGEVVCIVGQNGAGKSSTMAAIAGGITPYRGDILLNNESITGLPPENIARLGVSFIPEGKHVFPDLSVQENLLVGSSVNRGNSGTDLKWVFDYFPRLWQRRSFAARHLSGGEQQMLVIARALMAHPTLMLVDEPSLGLAPRMIDQVYEILLNLRAARGMTLLLNEQNTKRILRYADRFYVLRNGSVQLEGKADDLCAGEEIRKAYFGFEERTVPTVA